jgi:23S rRNA pseudouridine2605 synthase
MDNDKKTLVKVLVDAGLGSRRAMSDAIKKGRVKVNDVLAEGFTMPVDPIKDVITLDDKPIASTKSYKYIILNKPIGYVSSTEDAHADKTVLDLLPKEFKELYPAGRLDQNSRGLVIMTNDGDMTYRITHPKFNKEKEYIVRLDRPLSQDDRTSIQSGVELEDGPTSPCRIKPIQVSAPIYRYSIVIHEGRKRQVRRMFAAFDYKVLDLIRIRIGKVNLATLESGKWRYMTQAEIDSFKK